jgi:GTPase SAR1 family protein
VGVLKKVDMHPDVSLQKFVDIRNEFSGIDFSETDTRVKIIDRILKECLKWSENDIKREDHVNCGYTDYQLRIGNATRLVIEAKKSGVYFDLPSGHSHRKYKLDGVIAKIEPLYKAIIQVQSYCIDIGCKHCIVTNGYQFIVFSAITIGKSWRSGEAICFHSYQDIIDNYSYFFNLFYRENVASGNLAKHLDQNRTEKSFRIALNNIHDADAKWARNPLYTFINPLARFIFSELLDNAQVAILQRCYITQKATKELVDELDGLFVDTTPIVANQFPIQEVVDKKDDAGSFGKKISELTYRYSGSHILLLMGGIGAGKSTFLHRYFKILLGDNTQVIHFIIDFRKASINTDIIEKFISDTIMSIWESDYKAKTHQLESINNMIEPTPESVIKVRSLITILKENNYSVVLVVDNVDQHPRVYQESLFLISNSIMEALDIIVIVSLREETFMQSMRIGVFDAFNIPKFHIPSPNMLSMLKERISYTLSVLDENYQKSLPDRSCFRYDDDTRKKLELYFDILLKSLDKSNNQSKEIIRILDNVSCGNMRSALEMFCGFIQSGNTDVQNIFNVVENQIGCQYQISSHQMIKSIMLGNDRYFSDANSKVLNIFDFDITISESHFNSLRILKYLQDRENRKSALHVRGYVDINEIINAADEVLISKDVVFSCLGRLVEYNLTELDSLSQEEVRNASFVKITIMGKFYLRYLIHQFVYQDLISLSTPISDNTLYNYVIKTTPILDLAVRMNKTRRFVQYLRKEEDEEHLANPEYAYYEFTNTRFMETIEHNIFNQLSHIEEKQKKRAAIPKRRVSN